MGDGDYNDTPREVPAEALGLCNGAGGFQRNHPQLKRGLRVGRHGPCLSASASFADGRSVILKEAFTHSQGRAGLSARPAEKVASGSCLCGLLSASLLATSAPPSPPCIGKEKGGTERGSVEEGSAERAGTGQRGGSRRWLRITSGGCIWQPATGIRGS